MHSKKPSRKSRRRVIRCVEAVAINGQLDTGTVFDSKQGKLVNRYRCARCGKVKASAQ